MRGLISISTLSLLATLVTAPVQAMEFRSVGATPVIMYDAPSVKGGKVYVAPRGMPVEVIFTSGAWSKVRDMAGDLSWVESKDLITRRNLIVRVANAKIRASADDSAALVFSAEKNVLLEMAEPASAGWVKVRHRDGQLGYVKVNEVWGL
ncbi:MULTISPECIES: SH3 domain-containing protein [Undibacterium]|jgi:SH3-like domain-containing protein|uniref:SH3 domain-containing protein n=1 Tax=Undibacterium aquatile TaxID=1537398 RepID=A0ABR6XID6_9BURK|nr:SH3 domain-containing protein [Undibacterium aquatile]MBC3877841.1 SH3 domain-containing protein [Undibacterium sp. FT79W]MBC3928779.1 SH3 domain-containing protein [Undibacterium sp. CY21W]MBY0569873.1 SH3 domain-containing protein [Burkholderiaceae bacterium]